MVSNAKFESFLTHFRVYKRQGNKVYAYCPAHHDNSASLSITLAGGDKVLLFCHAGCSVDAVLSSVNLELADLFLQSRRSPEAIYQYRDKDGTLLYEKLKFRQRSGNKLFYQRRLNIEGELVDNLKGVSHVPYNYPGVIAAIEKGEIIVMTEGEKDSETARILGFAGTTMGGASDWKDEWKGFFRDATVVQITDNDTAGVTLVQKITKSLSEVSRSVKVVILPEGKDLTEWVTLGHGRGDLDKLIGAAPELVKSNRKLEKFNYRDFTIEHDALLSKPLPPLDYLVEGLIATPGTAILAAPKKRAKSFMASQLSQNVAAGTPFLGMATKQGPVIHMALEDGERRLKQRLVMQHAAQHLPITYITRFQPLNSKVGFQAFAELVKEKHPALVVIDTLAAAKNRLLDENSAGDTADLFNNLHSLAITENTVILVIAHHGKASTGDAGFDIRGSSAIPGATDVNIGLYKNTDGTFEMKAEGRDIGEVDLRITFDSDKTWCWRYQGDAKDMRRAEAENRIFDAIDLLGGETEASAIAHELEINRVTVQTHLKRMRDEGLLKHRLSQGKTKRILYSRPLTTPTSSTPSNTPTTPTSTQSVGDVDKRAEQQSEANCAHRIGNVGDVSNIVEEAIGMPVSEAIEMWRVAGSPPIHVRDGDILELEKFLSRADQPSAHLEEVRNWLEKRNHNPGEHGR